MKDWLKSITLFEVLVFVFWYIFILIVRDFRFRTAIVTPIFYWSGNFVAHKIIRRMERNRGF